MGGPLSKRRGRRWATKYASVYAKSYAEVKNKLFVIEKLPEKPNPTMRLYMDVLTEWLDGQALSVNTSTHVKFRNLVNWHINPSLGKLPVEQLSTARLVCFMQEKAERGRLDGSGLSNSTMQALQLILKSSLEYAAREQYMPPMAFALNFPEMKGKTVKP